jgi:activator of 2-hydroxyglutaryl-CoA dehydratase
MTLRAATDPWRDQRSSNGSYIQTSDGTAASRAAPLVRRVGITPAVVFIGGVALSTALRDVLADRLGTPVHVADDPQLVAALGCALTGIR